MIIISNTIVLRKENSLPSLDCIDLILVSKLCSTILRKDRNTGLVSLLAFKNKIHWYLLYSSTVKRNIKHQC